jgi:HEAT repeat protein
MRLQLRARWLPAVMVVTGAVALPVSSVRIAAQTRQAPVEGVIYDLKHPDPVRRQTAVRDLGNLKYRSETPDLVAMVHDPSDAVRRELELSLEKMEDIQAVPGFIALASDAENDIRARAVSALVNVHLPRERGLTATLSKLGEVMTLVPERDLEIMVEPDVAVDPAVIETLRTRLGDSERGIRKTAIRGLGILRAKAGVPDLLLVVREDRDDAFRFEAVRALRKIDDRSIADQLVALLNLNADTVRNELMATLGAMRDRGAVPELSRIVEQAKKPAEVPRLYALSALADIGDPASVPLFEQLKADKIEAIRLYANEGIARTADPGQKAAISAARLIEKSALVRTAQAFALLRIGESEYLDELIRAIDKSATRDLAKEYLLETPAAQREALFAPRTLSPSARAELAEVLGRMGDPNAMPRLQEMSRDADTDVARAAERASRRLAVTASQER